MEKEKKKNTRVKEESANDKTVGCQRGGAGQEKGTRGGRRETKKM